MGMHCSYETECRNAGIECDYCENNPYISDFFDPIEEEEEDE